LFAVHLDGAVMPVRYRVAKSWQAIFAANAISNSSQLDTLLVVLQFAEVRIPSLAKYRQSSMASHNFRPRAIAENMMMKENVFVLVDGVIVSFYL
jgi:hypothetical protein